MSVSGCTQSQTRPSSGAVSVNEALAALGATDWLYWLVLWTVQAMTQGFSVLVSQTFGSNDKKGLRKGHPPCPCAVRPGIHLRTVVFVSSAGYAHHSGHAREHI